MNVICLLLGHRWNCQRCHRCDAWRASPKAVGMPIAGRKEHQMKTWPEYYEAIANGTKRFEVRRTDDRSFALGDTLILFAWDPITQKYTGHSCTCTITYILPGGQHGIETGHAILGFQLLAVTNSRKR